MFNLIFHCSLAFVGIAIGIEGAAMGFGGGAVLSVAKLATILLLFIALLQFSTARVKMPSGSKTLWLVAFVISLVASGLYSFIQGTPSEVLQDIWLGYPGLILLYFLLSVCLTDNRRLNYFLWGMCIGMMIAALLGLRGVGARPDGSDVEMTRLSGIAGNANEVAFHLALVIPIAVSFAVTAKSKYQQMIAIGAASFLGFGMIATVSRSGLLSLIVMSLFWMIRSRRLDYLKYAIPFLAIVPLFIFLSPESTRERFQSTETQGRFTQYNVAIQALASNPILGIGPARIPIFARERGIALEETVHNVILKLASEHGLFGLIPFLAIVVLTWKSLALAYRYAKLSGTDDPDLLELGWRAFYIQIGFVGMAVIAQFHPQQTDKLLWALFGLATAIEEMLRARVAAIALAGLHVPEPVAFTPNAAPAVADRDVPASLRPPGLRPAPTRSPN